LVLADGEHRDDALTVATQVALRRAARFGRAPVRADLESAIALLSFDAPLPDETSARRRAAITGAAHDHWRCCALAEMVADEALGVAPALAATYAVDWSSASAL
jgi:hypothetical protein